MRTGLAEAGSAPALGRGQGRVVRLDRRAGDGAGLRLLRLVAEARGVPEDMLLHQDRCQADVALARQLAMYLMHVALGRYYAGVGRFFGRDRTTVSYACAVIEELREDPAFDGEVARLERLLEPEDSSTAGGMRHDGTI